MRAKVDATLQSRYVEYSGGKMVYNTEWRLHGPESCPVGCLQVGRMTWKEAHKLKKVFLKRDGSGNFEYRVI